MPKLLNDSPINSKSIITKIKNNTLLVSVAKTVINNENTRYPTNAMPSCFSSTVAASFSPKKPSLISHEKATPNQNKPKPPKAVVPKTLFRLASPIQANN